MTRNRATGAPRLRRHDAGDAAEDSREAARAGVVDFKRDLDQAALGLKARPLLRIRYGPHHLLGAGDALTVDELQRIQARRLLGA